MQPEEEIPSGQPGGGADPGELDRPKSRLKQTLWTLLGLAAALAITLAGGLAYYLGPAAAPGKEQVLLIRPGQSLPAIARDLEEQGFIRSAQAFLLLARLHGSMGLAKAGEFQVSSGWSPQEILRVITTTGGIQHRVVVREGLAWWNASRLFEAESLCNASSFEEAMKNATLLVKYGVPADSAEGYLFPETYQLPRRQGEGGQEVVEAMLKEFERQAKKLWPQGLPAPEELRRVVTLASLVEKETGEPSERPRIAGVFLNRLRLGMRLQCDPTTIYGLGPAFDGNLTRANLEDAANPYNTYARAGLPPGPICSPGLESLRAALNPEAHEFLYFVAKGDGSHEFSRTLEEHNRAVARYQLHRNRATYRSAPGPALAEAPAPAPAAKARAKPSGKPGDKPGDKSGGKTAKAKKKSRAKAG